MEPQGYSLGFLICLRRNMKMPANIETMFYVREKPWHGLGTEVQKAPTSADALLYAGLDWLVVQEDVYLKDGTQIPG